jgi:2-iminobutanoate/2-iminopropanoate deaminase
MSGRRVIHSPLAPQAIGPYSQAIAAAPGELIFCSGQVGLDPKSGQLVPGGVEAETRQVLANLEAVLAAAGVGPAEVVRTTIFLADMDDFAKVNAIYGQLFSADPPARATVQVAGLPKGARVEIDAIAVRPPS